MCPDFSFLPENKESFTRCFACGCDNPIGLKLKFDWDGRIARAEFVPGEIYQGWPGIAHGAIVMALLDEAMSYAALYTGYSTLTGRMNAKLKKPAPIGQALKLSGHIVKLSRKLIEAQAVVTASDGQEIARAEGTMYIVSKNQYYKDAA